MSHGPFTSLELPSLEPEKWESIRQARLPYRGDVPVETPQERLEEAENSKAGVDLLHQKLIESKPDVLVIFGDDQFENFNFSNSPHCRSMSERPSQGRQRHPGGTRRSSQRSTTIARSRSTS